MALQPKDEYYSEKGRESRIVLGSLAFVWEQRKVGELLIERNEQAPMSEEYPLMAFIANEGVAPKGERYDRIGSGTPSKCTKKRKEKSDQHSQKFHLIPR
ncbi:MAG: hypothetical protein GXZ14_03465 [Ruminococcaceae bacterium]|nr:hypothetical protein [Oscillospiraceae bacterium]